MDYQIVLWLNHAARSSAALTQLAVGLGVGLADVLYAVLLAVFVLGWRLKREQTLSAVLAGLVARLVLTAPIQFFLPRPRPFVAHPEIEKLFNHDPTASFPSGHASFFFGVAFSLWFVNRRWGWFFLTAATLVSLGRVASGVHYPSDILGGVVVGFAGAWLTERVWLWYRERLQTREV
ncbi:phosphatase PAP2 family protein [Candidatus Parcubacteria bacterium]|nr:phosphatase PAP2 family protein [Candidatus Parcubacteria bacterium]